MEKLACHRTPYSVMCISNDGRNCPLCQLVFFSGPFEGSSTRIKFTECLCLISPTMTFDATALKSLTIKSQPSICAALGAFINHLELMRLRTPDEAFIAGTPNCKWVKCILSMWCHLPQTSVMFQRFHKYMLQELIDLAERHCWLSVGECEISTGLSPL